MADRNLFFESINPVGCFFGNDKAAATGIEGGVGHQVRQNTLKTRRRQGRNIMIITKVKRD